MDHRTHERGVGMLNTPYVKKDTIKNFFPVPNAAFDLGLHHMEISIYAYLLRIEDRRTYQCIVSYPILLVAFPPAGRKFYPFSAFIKVINLAALGKPFPMFVHCPHSEQDMGVGIVSRRMGVMDGKISNHAFGNKLLLAKLPNKDSILVRRYLSGDGKHPPPCKLGVPLFFHSFGGVP